MSEKTHPSGKSENGRRITVRQLKKTPGLTAPSIVRAVRAAAGEQPIHAVSVIVTDDATLAALHGCFLEDPSPTDVMAFDMSGPETPTGAIDGEIVVSADAAVRMGRELSVEARQEVLRYVIHGMLHLCGRQDATPAQRRRMRRDEDRILEEIGRTGREQGRPASRVRRGTDRAGEPSKRRRRG